MSQCSFPSTTYAPSATALLAQVTVSATKPAVTGMTGSGQASQGMSMEGLGARESVWSVAAIGMALVVLIPVVGLF